MPARRPTDERGMALAVTLFALVVIGALVAGTFFAGRLEQQSGQNTFFVGQAAEAAEAGLSEAIANTPALTLDALPVGSPPIDLGTLAVGAKLSSSRQASRLTSGVFLIRSLGTRQDAGGTPLATRTVGSLTRLITAGISINAGLSALGDVVVTGNATVSGTDATPTSWLEPPAVSCPAPQDKIGIRYNGTLTKSGSSTVTGNPASELDPSLNAANIFGSSTFEELKKLRTLTLPGDISGLAAAVTGTPPVCHTALENNWGAPTDRASPCFNYFPVIYRYGDLSLSGSGNGQGILLVEGNLNAQGRIDFYGPVIVTGAVYVRGTGSDDVKFYGGIIARDVALDDSRLSGNATVNYSSCAIRRALRGSATLQPLGERGWIQLY
ncbi:MAG TPA: hypothetical protein VFU40_12355 [Gemmatimonadales bacterium]|nr:hypothetical protein [Gemmatimonadales bacterium]